MSFTITLILLVYVGHRATLVESRSFYPAPYNDYPPVKYNDIGDGDFDEVHEVHEDHVSAAVTQQHEPFSPTVISPTVSSGGGGGGGSDEDEDDIAAASDYGGKHYNPASSGSTGGYKYEYHINSPYTGDYKTQQEERVGDVVRGSYSFIESDGRKRIVEYTADPIHGFNAIVKHEPANALHLQRSIRDRDPNAYNHLYPARHHHAVEIERPEGTSSTVANLVPTLPTLPPSPSTSSPITLKPTWIVSPTPTPSPYSKKQLFYAKPPPPPPPYRPHHANKYIAVPDRSHLDGRPFVTWPFLYGI